MPEQPSLESLHIAALFLDSDYRIRSFTSGATELYGLIESDIGRPLTQLMPLVDGMPALPEFDALVADSPLEHLVSNSSGNPSGKSYIRRVLPIEFPDDTSGIAITFTEVSQLCASYDALSQSHAESLRFARRLKTITDATPTMIAYVNADLRYELVNKRHAERFGKSPDEVRGQKVIDTIGEKNFSIVKPYMDAALRGEGVTFEFELQTLEHPEAIFKKVTYVPDVDATHTVVGFHVFATDITDQRNTLEKVTLAEERLRLAAEAAGFGTYQIDLVLGRTFWSAEYKKLVGVRDDADSRLGPSEVANFVHPDDRKQVARHLSRAKRVLDGGVHSFTHRIILPDGSCRWVRRQGQTVLSPDGRPVKIIGTLLDITAQKEIQQSLEDARRVAEAANESKSEFLANMSHEIRTPMSAIMGYTDILSRQLTDPDDIKCASVIRHNGKFLLEIINDILDISKIEAGKLELNKKRFRPDRLVADVCSLMEIRAAEKSIPLEVTFSGEIPKTIRSDDKRLKQILVNLIGNAIKFTMDGGVRVVVSFHSGSELKSSAKATTVGPSQCMQFDVIDTGIGMDAKQIKTIFDPFTQGDSSVVRKFEGTGLGLSISQRLARMLGGDITVESTAQVGSKFSLTIATGSVKNIPMNRPKLNATRITTPSKSLESSAIAGHVLVVDDRRDMIFLAQHLIEDAGGTVTSAENGEVAIQKIAEAKKAGRPFDLITMDMQMPVLDGYEATRRLRETGCTTPIVAVTAHAMQGDREKCIDAGCTDYITKPLDGPRFLALLSDQLVMHPSQPGSEPRDLPHDDAVFSPILNPAKVDWQSPDQRCNVLLIDDAKDACHSLKTLLGFSGHKVVIALDGRTGMDMAVALSPAVIILDLGLPDMSGFDVIAQLKSHELLQNTIFIAATGRDNLAETKAAGFDHHLIKPIDVEELESLIDAQLAKSPL
ncbi:response regulator [Planctomycetes bacterium K23_9]|uniref:histidine kinase n=1 Tax=Stieleria marina TaxID=1930275 RepID=A0A517NVJ1_9BACT|nr:Autoinducer 2 sensor kinase/phosphatase LuxQ [Planctomycetes bacterium K23_9]